MGAHPLELWLLLSHKIHLNWMLLSLLIYVEIMQRYLRCTLQSNISGFHISSRFLRVCVCVCVYPTTPWSNLGFVVRSLVRAVQSED